MTSAPLSDKGQLTRAQIQEFCRDNLALFSQYFFPHHVNRDIGVPGFHREIYNAINDRKNEFVAIIAPRGFAKTTVALKINTLHDIAYGLEKCIVLISETSSKARRDLAVIQAELRFNNLFRAVYGDLTSTVKWTQDDIVTRNGIYVVALGSGKQIRGLTHPYAPWRPTKIILDDPESINTNVMSSDSRRKTRDWFYSDVCFARSMEPKMRGIVRVIGTIVHHDCLLANLKKDTRFSQMGRVLFYQAIVSKDGKEDSLWPEYYSLDHLKAEKRQHEKDGLGAIWLMEMMNVPMSETAGFEQRDLREWDGEFFYRDRRGVIKWGNLLIPVETVTCVDLASSEKVTGDFNVVMTCGMDSERNLYIIDYKRWRESNPVLVILEVVRQCLLYHPHTMGFETNAYQKVFARLFDMIVTDDSILRSIMENQDYSEREILEYCSADIPYPIQEINQSGNKMMRLSSLKPRFRAGMIYHMSDMEDFVEEYKEFPEGSHDDCLDALHMCDQISREASISAVTVHEERCAPDADVVEYGMPRRRVAPICL